MNVVNGYSGQFTVGHAAYLAMGSYTAAILMTRFGFSFWLSLPFAGIAASVFGFFVGLIGSKLSGLYLAMVTLGVSEILRCGLLNGDALTGGPLGIKNIPPPEFFGHSLRNSYSMYFIILIITVFMFFCTWRLLKSKFGRAWLSIRENEAAAASLGINTRKYKTINFVYASFWAGIAGAFIATYYRYIDSSMFGLDENFNILTMTIIGGMGTFAGPIAGVIAVNLISEIFRFASEYRQIIYALLIITMMWIRPEGLVGIRQKRSPA
jgi:branched-chain amino acid transport system permease protein